MKLIILMICIILLISVYIKSINIEKKEKETVEKETVEKETVELINMNNIVKQDYDEYLKNVENYNVNIIKPYTGPVPSPDRQPITELQFNNNDNAKLSFLTKTNFNMKN